MAKQTKSRAIPILAGMMAMLGCVALITPRPSLAQQTPTGPAQQTPAGATQQTPAGATQQTPAGATQQDASSVTSSSASPGRHTDSARSDTKAAVPANGAAPSAGPSAQNGNADDPEPAVDTSSEAARARASSERQAASERPRGKGTGKAMDHLELGTTDITGNRELPKVMYIVPWKRSDLGDLTGKPLNSLIDQTLQPVDRDVFRRENRYYRAVTGAGAAQDLHPTAGAGSGSAVRDER